MRYVLLCLLLCSCTPNVKPSAAIPQKVVIEVPRKLPAFATTQLAIPQRTDGTGTAILQESNDRGLMLQLANCYFALLAKFDQGQAVDEKDCRK
jgi:hypothetical protein